MGWLVAASHIHAALSRLAVRTCRPSGLNVAMKTRSGRTLVVSMLFNNHIAPASQVRAVQDKVIAILERG